MFLLVSKRKSNFKRRIHFQIYDWQATQIKNSLQRCRLVQIKWHSSRKSHNPCPFIYKNTQPYFLCIFSKLKMDCRETKGLSCGPAFRYPISGKSNFVLNFPKSWTPEKEEFSVLGRKGLFIANSEKPLILVKYSLEFGWIPAFESEEWTTPKTDFVSRVRKPLI